MNLVGPLFPSTVCEKSVPPLPPPRHKHGGPPYMDGSVLTRAPSTYLFRKRSEPAHSKVSVVWDDICEWRHFKTFFNKCGCCEVFLCAGRGECGRTLDIYCWQSSLIVICSMQSVQSQDNSNKDIIVVIIFVIISYVVNIGEIFVLILLCYHFLFLLPPFYIFPKNLTSPPPSLHG